MVEIKRIREDAAILCARSLLPGGKIKREGRINNRACTRCGRLRGKKIKRQRQLDARSRARTRTATREMEEKRQGRGEDQVLLAARRRRRPAKPVRNKSQ